MRTYHIHAVDGKPNVYHEEFTDSMPAWRNRQTQGA